MSDTKLTRRDFLRNTTLAGSGLALASMLPNSSSAETLAIPKKWDIETDVVVAGAGIAGCMAAIELANNGARVLLLQADTKIGGNSAISTGWIRALNTKWHDERGIKDTVDAYVKDGLDYGAGTRDPKKLRVLAEKSGPFVNRLIDYGVKFTNEEDKVNGGETLRVVKTDGRGGALMARVSDVVKKTKGITVKTESRVLDVYKTVTPDTLIGVKAVVDDDDVNIKCRALVLATGGFGRNKDLVTKYTNEWKDTLRIMDLQAKGDGFLLATSHGAGSANLQLAMVVSTMAVSNKVFYSTAPLLAGGIIVNQDGNRFVNELVTYTDTPRAIVKQQKVFAVLGEGMHPQMEQMIKDGALIKANTFEDLAKNLGVSVENIKSTIEEHNKNTREKVKSDRFGRTAFAKEISAPFYSVEIWPVMIETVGGILINEKSEVINFKNEPVMKGLYAAGAVAFGEHFGRGYRSGDAYVYSGVTGMVAGEQALKYIKS